MSAKRVGNYEIVRLLARGGTGLVYLVRQPALDREVVLKRLDLMADDPILAQRFVQEARVAAALDHPNIVTLFDFFEDDGVPYIAMEYVGGGSLRALVGKVGAAQIFGVAEGILAGLGHAERRGIAHRDLKPENVLLTRRGSVKIADFGIARAYKAVTRRLTVTGSAIGTPAYMAPEQALNDRIGPYTDLYALGVIVYELIAGRPPFDADTPVGILYSHVHTPPPPLRNADPDLGRWVDWLLEKRPADRPQSAAEAWHALEESAVAKLGPYWRRAAAISFEPPAREDEPPATTTEETRSDPPEPETLPLAKPTPIAPPPHPAPRPRRRRPAAIVASTGGLLGGAVAAMVLLGQGPEERSSPPAVPPPRPPRAATPYDFNGDGRQELALALLRGSARGSSVSSGVVLVHRGRRSKPQWAVITEQRAGVPGRARSDDAFGSGLASGDFDRDGHADLAIGTPGRDRVSVLYGADGGLLAGSAEAVQRVARPAPGGLRELRQPPARHGLRRQRVRRPDGQRPRRPPGAAGHGRAAPAVRRAKRARPPARPQDRAARDGPRRVRRAAAGGRRQRRRQDRPGRGRTRPPLSPGHAFYCPGSRRGPSRCRQLAPDSATSSLAVADVNGDGRDDIVQGDPELHVPFRPGTVRVWWGSKQGPSASPREITQDSPGIKDDDEPGDGFGEIVGAGKLDADGYSDIVVAATHENAGAGRITIVRGGGAGIARDGNSAFGQGDRDVPGTAVPGAGFGSALTILSLTGDDLLDLAVAAKGEDRADERVMIVQGGAGIFTPDETSTSTLPGIGTRVTAPRGGRIRLARDAGS